MQLETVARNAACDALVDLIDGGSAAAQGKITFETAGGAAEVCASDFANPAFGAAAAGVATANAIGVSNAATAGTIAQAVVRDRDSAALWTLTVGLSGAEVNLSSLTLADGETVTLSAMTVTVPAS